MQLTTTITSVAKSRVSNKLVIIATAVAIACVLAIILVYTHGLNSATGKNTTTVALTNSFPSSGQVGSIIGVKLIAKYIENASPSPSLALLGLINETGENYTNVNGILFVSIKKSQLNSIGPIEAYIKGIKPSILSNGGLFVNYSGGSYVAYKNSVLGYKGDTVFYIDIYNVNSTQSQLKSIADYQLALINASSTTSIISNSTSTPNFSFGFPSAEQTGNIFDITLKAAPIVHQQMNSTIKESLPGIINVEIDNYTTTNSSLYMSVVEMQFNNSMQTEGDYLAVATYPVGANTTILTGNYSNGFYLAYSTLHNAGASGYKGDFIFIINMVGRATPNQLESFAKATLSSITSG